MKKLVATLIATGMLLGIGVVAAQPATHELSVTIPQMLLVRIVVDDNVLPFVEFDFANNPAPYLAAIELGGAFVSPTDSNIIDIEVVSIGDSWTLSVGATAFAATSGLSVASADSDVVVFQGLTNQFAITEAAAPVRFGPAGYQSLNITGFDYRLFVDGDENPVGTHSIMVTYSVVQP
jgi:hypothetical protein